MVDAFLVRAHRRCSVFEFLSDWNVRYCSQQIYPTGTPPPAGANGAGVITGAITGGLPTSGLDAPPAVAADGAGFRCFSLCFTVFFTYFAVFHYLVGWYGTCPYSHGRYALRSTAIRDER